MKMSSIPLLKRRVGSGRPLAHTAEDGQISLRRMGASSALHERSHVRMDEMIVSTSDVAVVEMDCSANLFLRHEEKTAFRKPKKKTIPTVLVTGCLGAGKTTLVNHVLECKGDLRVAVAVNDFSEKSFDTEMLRKNGKETKMIDLSRGCICCSLSDGFQNAVWELLEESDSNFEGVDYLIIESSGVTDPLVVAAALDQRFGKMSRIRLDHVVCVVDAEWLGTAWMHGHANDNKLLMSQMKTADLILLNKADLCPRETLGLAKEAIMKIAPGMRIQPCCHGKVCLSMILEVEIVGAGEGTVSHDPSDEVTYTVKNASQQPSARERITSYHEQNGSTHGSFVSYVFAPNRPVSFIAFQKHIRGMLPYGTKRIKGEVVFAELPTSRFIFQWSGNNRVDLMEETGSGMQSTSTSLAYISEHEVSTENVDKQLSMPVDSKAVQKLVMAMRAALEEDPWFEVLKFPTTTNVSHDSLAVFRLIGIVEKATNPYELERLYGINFDALNTEFVSLLNGRGGTHVFLPVHVQTVTPSGFSRTIQGLAWTPRIPSEELSCCIQGMRDVATGVCKRHLGHIRRCNCGF